jgi:hypothetical protein
MVIPLYIHIIQKQVYLPLMQTICHDQIKCFQQYPYIKEHRKSW